MTFETERNVCRRCGLAGRIVTRKTVSHHVKSGALQLIGDDEYKFCPTSNCQVVYYSSAGREFTVEDVREAVTVKAHGDSRPLCYCFGFMEGDVRREIEQSGDSFIPARISGFIRDKLCACEIRNPAGVCCLGEVNKTVKQFRTEITRPANEPIVTRRGNQTNAVRGV